MTAANFKNQVSAWHNRKNKGAIAGCFSSANRVSSGLSKWLFFLPETNEGLEGKAIVAVINWLNEWHVIS